MKGFEELKKAIDESKTIVLASHIMPDGDAIGSIGAMYHFLKEIGKEVYMIIQSRYEKFSFLPGIHDALSNVPLDEFDLLICLDSSNFERLDISENDILKAKKIAFIDHHNSNNLNVDIKIINELAPANCEIIYDFLKYMNCDISKNVAEYIYLGIMTDTGSFAYERTTGKTYRIAGEMVDKGINFTKTCKLMNDTYSETKIRLVSYIIDNMEVYFDGRVRIGIIDKDIIDKYKANDEDLDSLVNYLRSVKGTEVSIFIKYIDKETYKVSMRSENQIDVSEIARKFGGGGHKRAAGFNTNDLNKTKKELISLLERSFECEDNRNT